jgi:regulator of sigma E protease
VVLLRDGKEINLNVTPKSDGPDSVGYAGWTPFIPALIKAVQPGTPAAQAGLKPGDELLELDGKRALFTTAALLIQASNGKPVDFKIQREGKALHIPIAPVYDDVSGVKRWRVGVEFQPPFTVRQLPWGEALVTSVEFNIQSSTLTFEVLGKILTRHMSARSLSGPIGIAQISGQAYRRGVSELIPIMSMISMQLAIFNFLPIPVLDGGVILLLVIEGAMRHDLSLKVKERFVQVGLVILLLLVVVVTYFDLVKTFRPS